MAWAIIVKPGAIYDRRDPAVARSKDDKWISVAAAITPLAERIMEVRGHPDLIAGPWFKTGAGRPANVDVNGPGRHSVVQPMLC